jgi:3-hydroxyacyl-CoA dehydrogenase
MLDDPGVAERIVCGSLERDLGELRPYDWVCEAIVEDLQTKRALLERVEPLRRDGSVVSTNTSGIRLGDICAGMPERLERDIAVTHFFNPVKVMRLLELVPGAETTPDVVEAFARFGRERLGKGVVFAKDTVNFIGNRIGCFWMLSGLHKAKAGLQAGLTIEDIDALLSKPLGIPATGLYGLIDLVGLDVLALVGRNLEANLPSDDPGLAFVRLPVAEQAMLERNQLGRKTGGGFYRLVKQPDGSRQREVFDPGTGAWRPERPATLQPEHLEPTALLFAEIAAGRFAWDLMSGTLCYAADLVPEIADDLVNIDRAMRWGFNWAKGPFELLDTLGPDRVIARLERERRPVPRMLSVLRASRAETFYRQAGNQYLGLDGSFHPIVD